MASQATVTGATFRASVFQAIIQENKTHGFKDLPSLRRWFIQVVSRDFLQAVHKEISEDQTLFSAAYGCLATVACLLDTAIKKKQTLSQFIDLVEMSIQATPHQE